MFNIEKNNKVALALISLVTVLALVGLLQIALSNDYPKIVFNNDESNQASSVQLYKVTKVIDGDTIEVQIFESKEVVRLIGVDTPETKNPRQPIQCYGPESSDYTKSNLLSKKVRLESDSMNQDRDRYSRLLRYVYLEDGTLWNEKLITDGYGYAYTNFPFSKLASFKSLEQTAKNTSKGLWGACN